MQPASVTQLHTSILVPTISKPTNPLLCFFDLPLGVRGLKEALEDGDDLVEGGEVGAQVTLDLGLVAAELGVEVLAVGAGAHGGAEDGLDEEAVVGLEGGGVGGAEGIGKLLAGVSLVLAEGNAGELEATAGGGLSASWFRGWGEEATYRTSHRRPSVAVCFLDLISLRQRS